MPRRHFFYECSECGAPVKITPPSGGVSASARFSCEHRNAGILANREATKRSMWAKTKTTAKRFWAWATGA